jgi:hypothetical protein
MPLLYKTLYLLKGLRDDEEEKEKVGEMEGRSEERETTNEERKKRPRKGSNEIINKCILKMLRHDI